MTSNSWLAVFLNLLFFVILAPLATGFLGWSKARLQLRRGPNILQPYRDLWKLWHVEPRQLVVASSVFAVAPYVSLLCYIIAGTILPIVFLQKSNTVPTATFGLPSGDLLVLIYLLGLAKFAIALGGMDSGSSFGHMGSSRSMFVHVILEPGLILSLAALALHWNTTDLPAIITFMQSLGPAGVLKQPTLLLVLASMLMLTVAEAERLPFDNPATHLELTMTERAIHIEYAGRQLAAIEWAEALKRVFLLTLLIDLFIPHGLAPLSLNMAALLSPILYTGKLVLAILVLAIWESAQGQLRLREPIWPAALAAGLALSSIAFDFIAHILL